jgi:HlyD family secretion protein
LSWAAGCAHPAAPPALAEVTRGDLVIGVEVAGLLQAVDALDINPPALYRVWNFKIASLAAEGTEVKLGDPVVGFDASDQNRQLETMRNEAEAAQKKLDKKRDDAQLAARDDELKIAEAEAALHKATLKADAPADLVASIQQREVQLDEQSARLALEAAHHHAEQVQRSNADEMQRLTEKANYARDGVAQLQQVIARLRITAPRAGTVIYVANDDGEKPKVGDTAYRGSRLLSIVGLGQMRGEGQVDEVDMARLAVHQEVVLRVDALPDVQLHGSVESLAHTVQAQSKTDPSKIVKLQIAIAPTKAPLRPGMRFRGEIETEHLRGVVQVPADAVFATADGPVAYRSTAGGFERVRLELGRRTQAMIEVKAGLQAGDRVSRSDQGAAI